MKLEKNMTIGEALDNMPEIAPYLLEMGMHCLGCPASRMETFEQACMVHGVDPDAMLARINEQLGLD